MKFILGTKLGMTQVFREDGTVVPVTKIQAGPCVITQVKRKETEGVDAVQVGYGEQKKFRHNKPMQGHLKGLESVRFMKDFRVDNHDLQRGDKFDVSIFEAGEKVEVTGRSKGKGFQGVVKRHGFAGSPATHGHKDQLRMPGSIGATDAARVFKGTRMGGHMGDEQVTVKNLEIIGVLKDSNELLVKGAIPGARGGLLLIQAEGAITPEMLVKEAVAEVEATTEEVPEVTETAEAQADVVEVAETETEEAPAVEAEVTEAPAEEVAAEETEAEEPAQEDSNTAEAESEADSEEDNK